MLSFHHLVVANSLRPRGPQHARPPCLPLSPELTQTHVHCISDAIQPSHPMLSLLFLPSDSPAARSFPMSRLFALGGQGIGEGNGKPLQYSCLKNPMNSMKRQEYHWSGLPFPSPEDRPNPGMKPASPALPVDSSPLSHLGRTLKLAVRKNKIK